MDKQIGTFYGSVSEALKADAFLSEKVTQKKFEAEQSRPENSANDLSTMLERYALAKERCQGDGNK